MEQKLAILFLPEVLQYLDIHQTMNMSNILRIASFVFIVAFLAYESKAALFFHHVNPPKKQQIVSLQNYRKYVQFCSKNVLFQGVFAKIKNYLYQPDADKKSCKEGLIPWKTICLSFWFR